MARLRMTRIESPAWARTRRVSFEDVNAADQEAIEQRRNLVLAMVHSAVEDYVNDPEVCFEDHEDYFPKRSRLTGEYYVEREFYKYREDKARFQIMIMCHCLEGPKAGVDRDDDYLGLDVWLNCEPGTWNLSWSTTNSSSI